MAIDLDAARAARREAKGEAPTVVFGGETFALPVEMPFELADLGRRLSEATTGIDVNAALVDMIRALLGEDFVRFTALRPSMQDIVAFVEGIPAEYGLSAGESQASPRSLKSTTKRSKPTSRPATA